MKRSGTVGLVMMGGAAFAATFAGGMAYFAWQKPSQAASATAPTQSCTPGPDGTQNCQPARRGFVYYLLPSFAYGSSGTASRAPEPKRAQSVALINNTRAYTPNPSGVTRGGFGTTARSNSYRTSAGG